MGTYKAEHGLDKTSSDDTADKTARARRVGRGAQDMVVKEGEGEGGMGDQAAVRTVFWNGTRGGRSIVKVKSKARTRDRAQKRDLRGMNCLTMCDSVV